VVQPWAAKRVRACAYDRAGVGFSDPGRRPATAANVAADLHRLLAAARIGPPYVLVAHSFGGLPAMYFASRYRNETAGLVLVDTTHEDEIRVKREVQPSFETGFMKPVYVRLDACVAEAERGFKPGSELYGTCIDAPSRRYSDAINAAHLAQHLRPAYQAAVRSESLAVASGTSGDQVREIAGSFGDLPLVVLSSPRPTGAPPPGVTPELRAALNRLYTEGKSSVARRSSRGVYRAVTNTGHYIQFDRPDVVEDAIGWVLDEAETRLDSDRSRTRTNSAGSL
jgi:pimeloyl-ACP methyl ester carboxylesterase